MKNNAIEFTKKSQSVTYLVFSVERKELLGYFTLALKPLTKKWQEQLEYNGYFYSVTDTIVIPGCMCGLKNSKLIHQWATDRRGKETLKHDFGVHHVQTITGGCVSCHW